MDRNDDPYSARKALFTFTDNPTYMANSTSKNVCTCRLKRCIRLLTTGIDKHVNALTLFVTSRYEMCV